MLLRTVCGSLLYHTHSENPYLLPAFLIALQYAFYLRVMIPLLLRRALMLAVFLLVEGVMLNQPRPVTGPLFHTPCLRD